MVRLRDVRAKGLFLIFVIIGAEGARMTDDIAVNSASSLKVAARKRAAAAHRSERSLQASDEKQEFEHAMKGLRWEADGEGVVMEGFLNQIDSRMKQGYSSMYARLSPLQDEPGSAVLDLVATPDVAKTWEEHWEFCEENGLLAQYDRPDVLRPVKPWPGMYDEFRQRVRAGGDLTEFQLWRQRITIRHDDEVSLSTKDGKQVLTIRALGGQIPSREGIPPTRRAFAFVSNTDDVSVHVKGEDKLQKLGTPGDVAVAWMEAIRIMQTVGTCLESATCVAQCTYLQESNTCSSTFCDLVQERDGSYDPFSLLPKTRGRCMPKTGHAAVREAWATHMQEARHLAKELDKKTCFVSCQDKWAEISRKASIAISLKHQLEDIFENPDNAQKLPSGMAIALGDIKDQAGPFVLEISDTMSQVFDRARANQGTLHTVLEERECGGLQDGALQAAYRFAVNPDDLVAAAQMSLYNDQCPLFEASQSQGFDGLQESAANTEKFTIMARETRVTETMVGNVSTTILARASGSSDGSSLVETEWLALAVVVALGALSLIFVTIGIALLMVSRSCVRAQSMAQTVCFTKTLGMSSPCVGDARLGAYFIFGGVVLMVTILGVLVWSGAPVVGGIGVVSGKATVVAETGTLNGVWVAFLQALQVKVASAGFWETIGIGLTAAATYYWGKVTGPRENTTEEDLTRFKAQQKAYRECMEEMGEPLPPLPTPRA